MTVTAPDATTVVFDLAAPKPGLIETFTSSFIQPFQPVHFLGQFHPEINPDADALAQAAGFENGYEVVKAYFGSSDWTDTPTMMFIRPNEVGIFQPTPCRRWKATSLLLKTPKAVIWSQTHISTKWTQRVTNCHTSTSKTNVMCQTQKFGR